MRLDSIKLISWDVDGTLYSIGRMKLRLMSMFLQEVARGRGAMACAELATLRRYRAWVDAARSLGGGHLGKDFLAPSRKDILSVEERWYGRAIKGTGPRSGVANLLSFLASKNIPQVVLTDYYAAYKLAALGLEDRFAALYVGESLGFVKPSPKGFERVAADFGIPLSGLLHIGDRTDRDETGAHAAGCQCLILGRDFRNYHSLLKLLRSMT